MHASWSVKTHIKAQTLSVAKEVKLIVIDNKKNIIFVKDYIVIKEVELDKIDDYMEDISNKENHCFHYLLIHEQYFYPHYFNYEPDYRERVFAAVDFCHRNGYRPATLTSVALEPRF